MSFRSLALCALLLASPALAQDTAPEAPPPAPASPSPGEEEAGRPSCDGRNPFYCGAETEPPESAGGEEGPVGKALRPPGGCEGRNPLYCQELEPEAPAAEEAPARKEGRNPRNPSRNPHRRPRPQ